jgi:hypothetical protein
VNDAAGLPIIQVDSDTTDIVNIGPYGTSTFVTSGTSIGIGTAAPISKVHIVDRALAATGGLSGSILNLEQTWNTSGTPTAIKLNVTDTASNAASKLIDLQVSGVSQFNVSKIGFLRIGGGNAKLEYEPGNTLALKRSVDGGATIILNPEANTVNAGSFVVGTRILNSTANTYLHFGTANLLEQQNGVNPQAFRLYNTYTSSTNFERLNLRWDTNVVKIGTEKGSAGGTARSMEFQTDAATRITIKEDGNVGIGTTNPLYPLHILGNTNGVVRVRVENTGPAVFQAIAGTSKVASFSVFNGVVWDAGVDTDQKFKIAGPNGDVAMLSTNTRLAIDSSGNIGIGNTSPTSKLQVTNGDIEVETIASGLILKSPDGTRYRVTVANGGTLSVAAV